MRFIPAFAFSLLSLCLLTSAQAESIPALMDQPNISAAEQLNEGTTKQLSPKETQKFLKTSEAGAWKVYAVQGPLCESTKEKKPKNVSAKAWAAKKKECVRLNTECRQAQNLAKKYSVQSICSNVYYTIDILLTTAASSQ